MLVVLLLLPLLLRLHGMLLSLLVGLLLLTDLRLPCRMLLLLVLLLRGRLAMLRMVVLRQRLLLLLCRWQRLRIRLPGRRPRCFQRGHRLSMLRVLVVLRRIWRVDSCRPHTPRAHPRDAGRRRSRGRSCECPARLVLDANGGIAVADRTVSRRLPLPTLGQVAAASRHGRGFLATGTRAVDALLLSVSRG